MVAVTDQDIALTRELREQNTDLVDLILKKEQALTEVKAEYDDAVNRLELLEALLQEVDEHRLAWVSLALCGDLDEVPLPDTEDDDEDREYESEDPDLLSDQDIASIMLSTGSVSVEDVKNILSGK